MSRLNPLSLVRSFALGRTGFRLEFEGGHVVEYRREEPAELPPLLEPPTFLTTGEPVEPSGSGLARCLPSNVVTLPRRRMA